MPDPLPPTPTPDPANKPTRPKAAPVNQEHLGELELTGAVVAAALKPAYAPLLAKREIAADYVAELATDLAAAQVLAGQVPGKTAAKEGVTGTETDLRDALVERLQDV